MMMFSPRYNDLFTRCLNFPLINIQFLLLSEVRICLYNLCIVWSSCSFADGHLQQLYSGYYNQCTTSGEDYMLTPTLSGKNIRKWA